MSVYPDSQSMALGVVIERRDIENRWQSHQWRLVDVIPGAAEIDAPRLLREGPGWAQYHVATPSAVLHRGETEGYKRNLSNAQPVVYVLLRFDGEADDDMPLPSLVTVCPYEAQDYLDAGDLSNELVESVPMPDAIRSWVQDYVEAHHVDEPFKKRKRKAWKDQTEHFARPPGGPRRTGHG